MPKQVPLPSAIALAEPAKPKVFCQCGSKEEVPERSAFCSRCCSCESHRQADEDGQCMDCRELNWDAEMLVSHKRFGPAIIGRVMHAKCQAFCLATSDNRHGPAVLTANPDQRSGLEKKSA